MQQYLQGVIQGRKYPQLLPQVTLARSDLEDIPKIFNGGDNTCSRDDMSVLEELKVAEFAGDPLNDDPAVGDELNVDVEDQLVDGFSYQCEDEGEGVDDINFFLFGCALIIMLTDQLDVVISGGEGYSIFYGGEFNDFTDFL
ncbi:MAG: hypothetical protein EZS28_036438 [Streblomastix strix]|uniref:Uncharacterized protein n=1 Tax=Streblomastix strix TaxID=222440 RepID=A0A5J4UEK3_9EUKA|nr:MAG: hypothetical protein EZS28_036438 [Streblomastix strix]